jgi:hypothetical protein
LPHIIAGSNFNRSFENVPVGTLRTMFQLEHSGNS